MRNVDQYSIRLIYYKGRCMRCMMTFSILGTIASFSCLLYKEDEVEDVG
jgi:hypothetical protein